MRNINRQPPPVEVWMQVKDRKHIAKIMVIQGVSQRELARQAGYKSHAYMGRILRGEVKTLDPEAAVRIAAFLGVGVDDIFLARASNHTAHNTHQGRAA